ncbi:hypothetical protein M2146_001183 [Lachnospiraceae bacterium PF1-22]
MAKYHKGLKYHKDTVKKHKITKEELEFLMQLQKEMNTQDHVCQADPRYWVIKGTIREYGIAEGYEYGSELCSEDGVLIGETVKEVGEYIVEDLLEGINMDGVERSLQVGDDYIKATTGSGDEQEEATLACLEDIAEWLTEASGYEYNVFNYRNQEKIYENTLFFTQKAAEEHLKANHYHYPENAHTYAMTGHRSPEVETMWKIIQQVDWYNLLISCCKEGE